MPARRLVTPAVCAALFLLSVAGCGDDSSGGSASSTVAAATTTMGSVASAGPVAVTGAWARSTPAGAENAAAYFVLRSSAVDALVAVTAPATVSAGAEIHETMTMGGSTGASTTLSGGTPMPMTMAPVAKVPLPAGKAVTFQPGGYHVMLTKLTKPLVAGQSFELLLTFEKAGTVTVKVEVRDNG